MYRYLSLFFISLWVSADETLYPELIQSNITDLSYIEEISKFRSGAGHEFYYDPGFPFGANDSTEPPSNMKHYFSPYDEYKDSNGTNNTVPVYAPFSGTIVRVTNENCCGYENKRVEIQSNDFSSYKLIFFHIDLDEAYPQIYNDWPAHLWPDHLPDDTEYETLTVSAGEFIGYADLRESNDFDIAVLREDGSQLYWVSFFDLLSDTVQDEYTSRGVVIENFIISKEARSSEPVTWWGGRNDDDWILLSPFNNIPSMGILSLLVLGFSIVGAFKVSRYQKL